MWKWAARLCAVCLLAEASGAPAEDAVRFLRHAVLLHPSEGDLTVRENIALRNSGHEAVAAGVFRFYVPDSAVGTLRVFSRRPDGTTVEQVAVKTGEVGVYSLGMPLEPGDTQVDLSYVLPFSSPGEFAGKTLQKDVPVRLVAPSGVTLTGDGLKFLGQEQKSGAANYRIDTPEYRVLVAAAAAPVELSRNSAPAETSPTQVLPRIYGEVYAILGLAFAVLALGFIRLYRMSALPMDAGTSASQSKATVAARHRRPGVQRA